MKKSYTFWCILPLLILLVITAVSLTESGSQENGAHAFSIKFDYRFDNGYFSDPAKRKTLEDAAYAWARLIKDDFPEVPAGTAVKIWSYYENTYKNVTLEEPIDDVLVFVFTVNDVKANTRAYAGPFGSWSGKDKYYQRYCGKKFQPWLISMTINIKHPWFFDGTPDTDDDIPAQTHLDFFQTALHEIGHGLGIVRLSSPFAFTDLVKKDLFYGKNAMKWNRGLPIPLEKESSHILKDFGQGLLRPHIDRHLMHSSDIIMGFRAYPSELDIAMLNDIGYTIDGPEAAKIKKLHQSMPEDPRKEDYMKSHPDFSKNREYPVGLWYFDRPEYVCSSIIGYPVRYMPPAKYPVTHKLAQAPEGGVIIPKGGYLIVDHGMKKSGGGKYVNRYSIVLDIRIPRKGLDYTLYNTNYANANIGEAFIAANNKIGQGGYSDFTFEENKWYRVILTVDLPNNKRKYYVDGSLVLEQGADAVDGRFAMNALEKDDYPLMLLFGGIADECNDIHVKRAALYDYPLSDAKARDLGTVGQVIQ